MLKLNKKGDTIVEVLISIAIVGTVLGGAFVASNRSQKSTLQAQDHSIALKIAEGQLEIIKGVSSDHNHFIFGPDAANPFCMKDDSTHVPEADIADCNVTNGIDYNYRVNRTGPTGGSYIYKVTVTWDSIQGVGNDTVQLTTKVFRPEL